jgi:CO dehydrogenase maturation factor
MHIPDKPKPSIIALCGKGGVGKTVISAMMVRILSGNPQHKVLAIDADPAVGLSMALGIDVHKTVDDIRNDLIQQVESGTTTDKAALISTLEYEMLTALSERRNLAFLAIGRPEKEGCYCQVNHVLKDIIASLADNFDFVLIDGEAGIEQVNRRVMEKVTHLVLVSDGSAKGLNVAKTIKAVSDAAVAYETCGLIINRIRSGTERQRITIPPGLDILGWIPEDNTIRDADIAGKSILDIGDCHALAAARSCATILGLTVDS